MRRPVAKRNGDVRFEVSQGQWQGLPRRRSRTVDTRAQEIRVVQSTKDIDWNAVKRVKY